MMRTDREKIAAVRRLLEAARRVRARGDTIRDALAFTTGLSRAGIELALTEHLEVDASEDEIARLVACSGDAPRVHVILSANVFVAPLRAIAIARAASDRVTVRPSRREPVFARALVEEARDPAIVLEETRAPEEVDAGEIHVYGRDETIEDVRKRAKPGVRVRGHGAGMGIAVVSPGADLCCSAELLARDVVAFDQRGCLSPRVAFVVGDRARADTFAEALDAALASWQLRVPRGALDEVAEARRWIDAMTMSGRPRCSADHAVAVGEAMLVPPPGRHVLVVPAPAGADARAALAHFSRWIVAVGSDDPDVARAIAPPHARVSALGAMQKPPLDGPVDLREN
jgi:acyl-CoA reductase-like NAD-dependent aldehyde dehydrogenase